MKRRKNKIGLGSKKKVCSALLCHHTLYFRNKWIRVQNPSILPPFRILFWYWCLDIHANEVKKCSFESCMKIEHCVFLKIDILVQNWAWGHFSRFCTGFCTYAVFKFTVMEAPQVWPAPEIWALYQKRFAHNVHLNANWDTTIELYTGKVCWPLYIWIHVGASKEHSNEYYGQTKRPTMLYM